MMTRTKPKVMGMTLFALAATVGCGEGGGAECDPSQPVRLATFNGGLAPDVGLVAERIRPVMETLAAQELDLLCVQELWQDWETLTAAAAGLPNTVHLPPLSECPSGCFPGELDELLACGEQHCQGLVGPELMSCGATNCNDEVFALSPGCLDCVVSTMTGGGGMEDIAADCPVPAEELGDSYLFGCHYDTGILTSATIVEQESRPLDSYMVLSTVDFARIETGSGKLDVFCAHLQSEMDNYQGDFGSYQGEQAHQIDQLLAFVAEKDDGSRPVVLLGDLNTGPAIPEANLEGEWPDHYQRLLEAGFDNPYAAQDDVACTLCPDNTLRPADSDGQLIDHILLKNASSDASGSRFMTEPTRLQIDGNTVESNFSDHYGLIMELDGWCAE
jgi:endonuclease/exonuclease/phosphatase family metal-dependent hydrolase